MPGFGLRCTKIRLVAGLAARTQWGSSQCSSDSWIKDGDKGRIGRDPRERDGEREKVGHRG